MSKKLLSFTVCLLLTACSPGTLSNEKIVNVTPDSASSPMISNEWDQHVIETTKDWKVFASEQKGITFQYPASYYNESCPGNNNLLTVIEAKDAIFLVPKETLGQDQNGQTLCDKKHETKIQDISPNSHQPAKVFPYLTIYTTRVTSLRDIEKFYQQADQSLKNCTLGEAGSEFIEGKDTIKYINFNAKDPLNIDEAMQCGSNIAKYNVTKGIVAIYHGKLNGPWLYTDDRTGVDGELTATIKFL